MAFPTVGSRNSGGQSTNTKSHPWTAPSGIVAGNLLLAFYSFDSDNALDINPTATTTSSGWTKVGQASQAANNVTQALFYKEATGSDALTVVTDTEEQSQHVTYRISGGGVPTFTSSQGNTANSDPALHTPVGGSNDYLWLVSRAGDRAVVASSAPAGYSSMQTRTGVGTSSCSLQVAERTNTASSENPAAFTVAAEEWVCFTVSVPPGSGAPPVATDTPGSILNIGPIPGQNHFNIGIGYTSGHVDKSQALIAAGFSEPGYFELSPVSGWVRCSVPLDGKTTSANTQYARVELREMQEDGTTKASWNAGSGMHRIHITSKLIKAPPVKPQLVFCQVHDAEDDVAMILCKLSGSNIQIVARKGDTQVVVMDSNYDTVAGLPGGQITVGFEVEDGELRYYFNDLDTPVYTTTLTGTGMYFKAGAYAQSNTTIDSLSNGPFIVDIKELEHWHTGWATPAIPPAAGGGGGGGGTPGAPFYASEFPDGTPYVTFREGTSVVNVSNTSALTAALSAAVAGQKIVLANGTYGAHTLSGKDGTNSVGQGISIVAANKGLANLTSLTINNSNYVHVEGLAFPADPAGDTLQIRGDSQVVRITRCTLGPTSHPGSATSGDAGTYIFVGDTVQKFRIDHNYLRNKSRSGNGIRVYGSFDTFAGCKYGRIDHNAFENFYPEAVNDCEPIRYGVSTMSRTNASAVIERNHFFNCVSEPEMISGKMGKLRITGNTAQRCGGSFVIRHGRGSIMSDNYLIDGANTTGTAGMKSGGIRAYDSDHDIDHNYMSGLAGDTFQASLIIDTGDEEGASETLSGHFRVVNCRFRNNLIVDSLTGIKVGDNYDLSPSGCTVTGNRTANIASGSPPITYVGTTTLVSSTVTDNENAATPTALAVSLAQDSDNIWRNAGVHGPRITFIKSSMVGPDGDLDDLDGTGPGIAAVIEDPDEDPDDPDPELPPEENEPEPETAPPVNDVVQVQLPKTWYLGPAGDLRALTAIDTGATISQIRYGGVHQGLSGARTVDVTGLAADYDLSWKFLDEDEYSWLELLHTRHIAGPLRMLNPLKRNRLSARASRLVPATTAGLGAMTTAPYTKTRDWPAAVAVPGQSLSLSGWPQSNQSVRFDANLPTTVLNLETITGSVYVRSLAAHSGSIALEFYDYAGNFLSSTSEVAEFDVVWDRYTITRQVPSLTCSVVLRVNLATANTFVRIAAPQLEAGSSVTTWEPGGGAPVVVIDQMPVTTPRFPLRDVSVTLLEV